jgi:hypothetical protein
LLVVVFLVGGNSNSSEVKTWCGLDVISFMARKGQHFFMCFFGHLDFFLGKSSV